MVEIFLDIDADGALKSLRMHGHTSEIPRGDNLSCAALTLLARSVARLLANRSGWIVDGDASTPGELSLAIQRRPEDSLEWLKGVTDTFLRALADIDEEFPSALSVKIEERPYGS